MRIMYASLTGQTGAGFLLMALQEENHWRPLNGRMDGEGYSQTSFVCNGMECESGQVNCLRSRWIQIEWGRGEGRIRPQPTQASAYRILSYASARTLDAPIKFTFKHDLGPFFQVVVRVLVYVDVDVSTQPAQPFCMLGMGWQWLMGLYLTKRGGHNGDDT